MSAPDVTAESIVDFWLGPSATSPAAGLERVDWWYRGGPDLDATIKERFGERVEQARQGELKHWRDTSAGNLALVILLDQFTRNNYRGTLSAYSGDVLAFEVLNHAIEAGLDLDLPVPGRIFLYHPCHHSEDLAEQDRGIALLQCMARDEPQEWRAYIERSIKGWGRHRDIVARFGRFPHRNTVMGRETIAEEAAFIADGAESFGQVAATSSDSDPATD